MKPWSKITEAEWVELFKPQEDPDQTGGFVNYGYETEAERRLLEQMHSERRLWTFCYTAVGNPYIMQGFAYVNREFYIVCDVPYGENEAIDVESETLFCDSCGLWFTDVNDQADVSTERSPTCHWLCVDCQAAGAE